ncbi:MAG: M48 family metallopeptidase [Myxococcota bacterium]
MSDPQRRKRMTRIGTALAVILLVGFVSFPLVSGFAARFVPNSVQRPIGEQMIESTASEAALCTGDDGRAAIEGLAKKLAAASESDAEFRIYIADADVLNAFAAPGGYIVLFRAIIDNAKGPDEVAGVLAHEMGHVVEDHPAKGVVEALGYGIFGLLVPGGGADTAGLAKTLLSSAHSRGDELEADQVGVEMLNGAGIGSHGLVGFFQTLDEQGDSIPGALEFVSTHPTGETRTARLQEHVQDGEPALTEAEWEAVKSMCKTTGNAEPILAGG